MPGEAIIVPQRRKAGGKLRVSALMRAVIEHMVSTGDPLNTASAVIGMNKVAAQQAFRRPHVKRVFNQMVAERRDNAAQLAYLRIDNLAKDSEAGRLKLDANRWIAGVDGISPVQKVHGQHQHSLTFGGFTFDDPRVQGDDVSPAIEGEATEIDE